jgi:hypothetical protein
MIEEFDPGVFNQTFYGRTTIRGAGFKKYSVSRVSYSQTTRLGKIEVNVVLTSKYKNKHCFVKMFYINKRLKPVDSIYFNTLPELFVFMESSDALYKRSIKNHDQYKLELTQIKTKYPEYFL